MSQNNHQKGQQYQGVNNQGALNPERPGYGGVRNDDCPAPANTGNKTGDKAIPNDQKSGFNQRGDFGQNKPMPRQAGTNQQGSVGGFNTPDHTKPSAQIPQQGPVQQRGNFDVQKDPRTGKGYDTPQGGGKGDDSVEVPKTGSDISRR